MHIRVLKDWTQSYDPALKVARGGRLLAIREGNSKWSGWVWCTDESGLSGWLPAQVFDRVRIGKKITASDDFDTVELIVHTGDTVSVSNRLNDWSWCQNNSGQSGWVPDSCLAYPD